MTKTSGKITKDKKKAKNEKQGDYILLDRSGSMSVNWNETISSVNGYVHELAKKNVPTLVTLAVFDDHAGLQYDVIRAAVDPKDWKDVDPKECEPRGMTPLYDAVGRIVAATDTDKPDKAAIIIMTDGAENSSREHNQASAKALLDACQAKGWSVVFLGANFDNASQSRGLGAVPQSSLSMAKGSYGATLRSMASTRAMYGSGEAATMSFSDEDRKESGEAKIRR